MLTHPSAKGHTLVEMMVAMVVLAILLALAARSYGVWIINSQIRTAAETLAEGLSVARNEAIKRNRQVTFRLVTDLSVSCAASESGTSWVASVDDPTNKCATNISETLAPYIFAKKSAAEGTARVTIAGKDTSDKGAHTIAFSAVGRVLPSDSNQPMAKIDIDSSTIPFDQTRELRITVSTGGMIRMCDPSITTSGDTRKC